MTHTEPAAAAAWLTARQVAPMLGVTAQTVYRLAQSSELPCVRVGSRYRFRPAEIEQYLEAAHNRAGVSA